MKLAALRPPAIEVEPAQRVHGTEAAVQPFHFDGEPVADRPHGGE